MGEQVESLKKEMEDNRSRSGKGERTWHPSGFSSWTSGVPPVHVPSGRTAQGDLALSPGEHSPVDLCPPVK